MAGWQTESIAGSNGAGYSTSPPSGNAGGAREPVDTTVLCSFSEDYMQTRSMRTPQYSWFLGAFAVVVGFFLEGCASSQMRVESKGVFTEKPSNVLVYFSVTEPDQTVTDLTAEDFQIYEDGTLVPADHSGQVLLDKDLARAHRTLVLVDFSAATDDEIRNELASALTFFVGLVRKTQPVLIYAFDGREHLRLVADLPEQAESSDPQQRFFQKLLPADASRNLNGAILEGIGKMDQAYERSGTPLRAGTVVVFSGGPDLAGRVTDSAVQAAINATDYTFLAVGIGDSAPRLKRYGRDGFVDAHSAQTVSMAFEEAGHLVEADYAQHYLLSYCSPARAGTRQLRIDVVRSGVGVVGSGQFGSFDADGFTEGCDAKAPPRIETKVTAPAKGE